MDGFEQESKNRLGMSASQIYDLVRSRDLQIVGLTCLHCGIETVDEEAAILHDAKCPKHPLTIKCAERDVENKRLRARIALYSAALMSFRVYLYEYARGGSEAERVLANRFLAVLGATFEEASR